MSDDDPLIGKTIEGRYVLRRLVGRGGMGVVYEAEHAALDRRVAIKLIAAKQASEDFLTRFRREAKLASRISHEHLVHVYDVGTDAETGADFLVMEYAPGRDLGKELAAGPMGFARAISIARQLLEALHAIHEGDIIHRDIKPTNVMLTTRSGERDFVKLMDFGIARAIGDASLTMTGHVMGTPSYMSPEQLRGQVLDRRSDLYAVGVTLFAMIAGRLPFEGNTALLAGQHVFEPPPSLAKLRPGTPPALIAAVERALAKSPADRFPDALAFVRALDGETPPIAETQSPPTANERPPRILPTANERPPRRRSRAPRIAIVLAAAAVLGAILWFALRSPATHAPAETPVLSPRPVAIDAGVVEVVIAADAGLDAATVDPPAKTSAPDKRPKPSVAGGPPLACQCIPTNAPDIIGLCATRGPSLCRCDAADGTSLCPTTAENRLRCSDAAKTDCVLVSVVCPDAQYAAYHRPGRVDEPCSGFLVPRWGWGDPDPTRQQGHLECDVCAGAKLDAFRGHDGEACTGFYWRTGESKSGKLAHCQ